MEKKSIILITILVVVLAVTQAAAQVLPSHTVVFKVSGIVSCSVNGSVNGTTSSPPFPNAVVQLLCGGNTINSTVTNATGGFSIIVPPAQITLPALLSSCKVVVATPLASCNSSLPSTGTLQGPLQFTGATAGGTVNTIIAGLSPLLQLIMP